MKFVNQTKFGEGTGNCFTACVASILELPIDEVPDFCVVFGEGEWFVELEKWCAARGLAPLSFCLNKGEQGDERMLHAFFNGEGGFYVHKTVPLIASGKNSSGCAHSVVAYWDTETNAVGVHDPHAGGSGLVSYRDIIAFAALAPARWSREAKTPDPCPTCGHCSRCRGARRVRRNADNMMIPCSACSPGEP